MQVISESEYDDESEYDENDDLSIEDSDENSEDDPDWDPIWEVSEERRNQLHRWRSEHLEHLQTLYAVLMDTGEGLYGRSWMQNMSLDIFASFCFKYTVPGANRN